MNQDSSFPPMLPPSTELGALLFAVLPCLQESYRPLASFAYHMTELTRLKSIPSIPSLSGLSGIDALITDKDSMLRSLSFYGRLFRMPLLSTIANLLQALQFYQTYKDMIPGLFSAFGGGTEEDASPLSSMAGLFSGLGGLSGLGGSSGTAGSPDLFSMLGGLSPDIFTSLFSGFANTSSPKASPASEPQKSASEASPSHEPQKGTSDGNSAFESGTTPESRDTPETHTFSEDSAASSGGTSSEVPNTSEGPTVSEAPPLSAPDSTEPQASSGDELFDSLYSFLSPEQKEIYDKLMHTD